MRKNIYLKEYVSPEKITGVIHLECPECHDVFWHNTGRDNRWCECKNCHETFPIERIRRVSVQNCPYCELNHRYMANSRDVSITVGCKNIKDDSFGNSSRAPIDCFWNDNLKKYVNISEGKKSYGKKRK